MNICVLIKQVPGTAAVEIDPETGTLKRAGVESKLNPYDLFAIETALRLRQENGGEVCVLTMGPPQAESAVMEAIYMGCDRGVILSDRKFAGSDVLATSRTLSQGIKLSGDFDLIICGKQTTDGDTAQVGPETAEFCGVPHVTNVLEILSVSGGKITLNCSMGDFEQKLRIPFPALITMDKDVNTPRLPSIKRKYSLNGVKPVRYISFDDFELKDEKLYGLNGSPTKVERIFSPDKTKDKRMLKDTAELFRLLSDSKFV